MATTPELPPQGSSQDFVERLTAYVTVVDAGWVARTQAASDAQIQTYMELSGFTALGLPLPELYKEFLLNFGENEAGLLESETLKVRFSLSKICHFYKTFAPENFEPDPDIPDFQPEQLEPQLPVIGLYYVTGDQMSLDMRSGYKPDPEVRFTSSGEDIGAISKSFEALVFQRAFRYHEERRLPQRAVWSASGQSVKKALAASNQTDAFAAIAELAKRESLAEAWFNDALHFYGVRSDAALLVQKGDGGGVIFSVMGNDINFVRSWGNQLGITLGASALTK
jgi:hypothetical protein